MNVGVILLAGGRGSRMKTVKPKQLLELNGKWLVEYSLETFLSLSCFTQIVLVMDLAEACKMKQRINVTMAAPGQRRQDSVWNGLHMMHPDIEWVCIHDAARPFVKPQAILNCIESAKASGASALGVPVQSTIKQCTREGSVLRTIDRADLWEIQTPQVIRRSLLEKGFFIANLQELTVTDDLSLAELAGVTPQIVQGDRMNIKITTPEDLLFAKYYAEKYAAL